MFDMPQIARLMEADKDEIQAFIDAFNCPDEHGHDHTQLVDRSDLLMREGVIGVAIDLVGGTGYAISEDDDGTPESVGTQSLIVFSYVGYRCDTAEREMRRIIIPPSAAAFMARVLDEWREAGKFDE